MQQTSLEAYRSVSGGLNSRQAVVIRIFSSCREPLTNLEVAMILGWDINCVTPRVLELRGMRLLEEAGSKIQPSGREAIAWRRI